MPHDHHDELSPSGHPYRADQDAPLTYWQTMEIAIRELLIEKGVTSANEISAQIEAMDPPVKLRQWIVALQPMGPKLLRERGLILNSRKRF